MSDGSSDHDHAGLTGPRPAFREAQCRNEGELPVPTGTGNSRTSGYDPRALRPIAALTDPLFAAVPHSAYLGSRENIDGDRRYDLRPGRCKLCFSRHFGPGPRM
jgi:hypothetical protein